VTVPPHQGSNPIELDDPESWPAPLLDAVRAESDPPSAAVARALGSLVGDGAVRLYHATRLTDLEVAAVRTRGLRRASPGSVRAKAAIAWRAGALGADPGRRVTIDHLAESSNRHGVVWFCPWRAPVVDPDPERLWIFFRHWGGQAVWLPLDEPARDALQRIGRPALVVAAVPARLLALVAPAEAPDHRPWSGLAPTARLGLALWQVVHLDVPAPYLVTVSADVPAAQIEAVRLSLQPDLSPDDDPFSWPVAQGTPAGLVDRLAMSARAASWSFGARRSPSRPAS
jgi:hypothetical protein